MSGIWFGIYFSLGCKMTFAFVMAGGWFVAGGIAFAGTYTTAISAQKYIGPRGDLSGESILSSTPLWPCPRRMAGEFSAQESSTTPPIILPA
jgi:hypothetical protein